MNTQHPLEEQKEKWRAEFREEIRRWPEMDALGSADFWMDKIDRTYQATLALVSKDVEQYKSHYNAIGDERNTGKHIACDDIIKRLSALQDSSR